MQTINWKLLILTLFLLIVKSSLVASDIELDVLKSFIDTTNTGKLYENIRGQDASQKLKNVFAVADSLLYNDDCDSSLNILKMAYQDSSFASYEFRREIKFKIYDIYSYQWDFEKSTNVLKKIYAADSLLNNIGMMAHSSLWLASTYMDNNDYDNAENWISKSKIYSTEVDSTRILAYLYMLEGDIAASDQNFHSAFKKYSLAEKYTSEFPISNTTALIKLSLATVYSALDKNDVALKYYQETTDIYNKLEDYSGAALAIYNIAIAYGNLGDNEKALKYALESIDVCKKEENTFAISDMLSSSYSLVSQLYEREEKWDLSLKYLKLSDELMQSNISKEATIENINQYIRFYSKLNDYDNALHYVQLGDSLKIEKPVPFLEEDNLNARLEFYQTFGNYEKAIEYSREMINNIRNETSSEVTNLIAEFEAQKNLDKVREEKQRLDLLNTQKNLTIANQDKAILFVISLILLVSIIAIILYQRYKSKVKLSELLNSKVEERTKELKETNLKLIAEIEDHKETTNQLIFTHRLTGVGEIASGLAHEIRNPLTNIIASMQILKSRYNLDKDEFADIIVRNAQNANVRIKELLNYSQPIDFKLEVISIHRVISEVINLVKGNLNRENIELNYDPKSTSDIVKIDKKQINTVFLNFILNSVDAIKNTENKGKIQIKTYDEFNFVVIEFRDNGCGIEANVLPKIFQPFFTNKENGTGLGLNLAHKIIHQHGGIINAESKVGEYTKITVKLLNIKS